MTDSIELLNELIKSCLEFKSPNSVKKGITEHELATYNIYWQKMLTARLLVGELELPPVPNDGMQRKFFESFDFEGLVIKQGYKNSAGLMDGPGIVINQTSLTEGLFSEGKLIKGIGIYANGKAYVGSFVPGTLNLHGPGIMIDESGERYEGRFENGQLDGHETIHSNGYKTHAFFTKGKLNGFKLMKDSANPSQDSYRVLCYVRGILRT